MDQDGSAKILAGEGVVQIRQNDDGKLQPFGLVDAHETNSPGGGAGGGRRGLPRLKKSTELSDKGEQAPAAAGLELFRLPGQGDEVLPALQAVILGAEKAQEVQAVVYVPEETVDAHIPGRQTEGAQRLQKGGAVLLFGAGHGLVKIAVGGGGANLRQTVRGEAEDGRAEHGDQRHILPGIVNELQQGHGGGDLHGLEKAGLLLKGAGDVPLRQSCGKGRRPASRRAHEDDDVLWLAGAQRPVGSGDGIPPVQKFPDPAGGETGLRQELFHRMRILRRLLTGGDEVKFCGAICPGRVVVRAKVQGRVPVVDKLPHFHGENILKHKVGGVQNLLAGPEISREDNLPLLPLPGLGVGLEGGVFPEKNGGVRQTEAVDALLHIPHGKEVVPPLGDGPENGVLNLVGVLVLVHQNFRVPGGDLFAQLRGASVGPDQEGEGQMLLVGEVRGVQPEFLPAVNLGKLRRQVQKRQHGRGHGLKILQRLVPGDIQPGPKGLQSGLGPLPKPL